MRKVLFLLWLSVCAFSAFGQETTQGTLYALSTNGSELGACPLKNTAVNVEITGFVARVRVVQEFQNPFSQPIEAVYTFPMSQNGAVDDMTMTIGSRTIRGKVFKREEARKIYETAKSDGRAASLLDQERNNIFTQSVANIMPGESIKIEISYVETLKYEAGEYEFVFPMTVGPRYIPGSVRDASKISPPIATRAGHDISVNVNLNAGVPIEAIRSISHDIDQVNLTANASRMNLKGEKTIPNKDFILRYDVSGKRLEDALLTHRDARGGFFTLVLQPPDFPAPEDRTPKEIVFVLDTSGSMSGFPIEKAKEAMKLSLEGLYPEDTFNLITFAGDTSVLFEEPVPATAANIELAQKFLESRSGSGGTEMMKAIKAALDPSDSKEHLRVVCFMTDGFIGNENEIVAEIQRHPKARVFSFGIGDSVNRELLDKMAGAGRGEAEYVTLAEEGSKAAKKFYERVRTPMLTDISIEWNGMPVADTYPSKIPDLFSAKPVVIKGRYTGAANGKIKLIGKVGGQHYEREIAVNLPEKETANDALASLWARQRVDELTAESLNSKDAAKISKQITDLGVEFGLMTSFTSFVAVEEKIVNRNGKPVTVQVPVELPSGVNSSFVIDGVDQGELANQKSRSVKVARLNSPALKLPSPKRSSMSASSYSRLGDPNSSTLSGSGSGTGSGNGSGSGSGNGYGLPPPPPATQGRQFISGGVLNGKATRLPKPVYPPAARAVKASGTVSVQVTIDESGKVISAVPVSGHPLLRSSAANAASAATFSPTMLSGVPVKVSGVITYNFVGNDPGNPTITVGEVQQASEVPQPTALTPEQLRKEKMKGIFHIWLYNLVERVESKVQAGDNESKFVRDGSANIKIVLSAQPSSELTKRLADLGFVVGKSEGTDLTGSISIEKLTSLVDIEEVVLVLPN